MKKIFLSSVIFLVGTLFCVWGAGNKEIYETVSVSGTGTVKIQSDAAKIIVSVVTNDEDPAKAAEKNAQRMIDVQNAAAALGIKNEQMTTQNYSLYENYRYTKDGEQEKPEYRASNTITITVTDTSLTGKVIDAALSAGANQLSQLSFYSTKTEEAYDEARKLAIDNAHKKADFLASGAGRTLGRVLKIEETFNSYSQNSIYKADMMMAQRESTPISPEDSEVSVTYNFVYQLQ